MLIALYARVSTEDQARSGYSQAEQLRACRARAEQLAGGPDTPPVILEFRDDMPGDVLERPGLQAALDLLRTQKTNHFVCLDPDRLARRLMHQLLITDQIESTGCQLEFVQHDYQETPEGRLFYQLRGAVAEFEKAKILERTTRGARAKMRAGGIAHSLQMYGYDYQAGMGKVTAMESVVPNEKEIAWLVQMHRWCGEEGLGPRLIAGRLNELGIPTKSGRGIWRHGTVRRILRAEYYVTGVWHSNTRDCRGIKTKSRLTPDERTARGITLVGRPRPAEEWIPIRIPPVLARDVWESTQEVLAGFRVGERATKPGVRMLTSLGRCSVCGGSLIYYSGRKIACMERYRHLHEPGTPRTGCTQPEKSSRMVEAAVWQVVRSWVELPGRLLAALEQATAAPGVDSDTGPGIVAEIKALEEQVADKRGEQERAGLLLVQNLWPQEKALGKLGEISREIDALNGRLRHLRASLAGRPGRSAHVPAVALSPEWLDDVRDTVDRLEQASKPGDPWYHRKIELVRLLVARYVMHPTAPKAPPHIDVIPRAELLR